MLQLQRSFCDGRECGEAPEEVADTCRVACARASSRQEGQGDDEEAAASGTGRPQGRGGGARPSSAGLVGTESGPHLGQFYVRTTARLSLCDQGPGPRLGVCTQRPPCRLLQSAQSCQEPRPAQDSRVPDATRSLVQRVRRERRPRPRAHASRAGPGCGAALLAPLLPPHLSVL